jgi:hypothetical protein
MSVDTVIGGLSQLAETIRRQRATVSGGMFDVEQASDVLAYIETLRAPLMRDNVVEFNRVVDRLLARNPDTADFIMEDLFERLGINTREELSEVLAKAD